MKSIYVVYLGLLTFVNAAIDVRCTLEFCDEYVQKFPCPPLEPECSDPKKSIVIPSPTPCNCCERCFIFQEIGGECTEGRLGQPIPGVMCKPSTECVGGICKKKTSHDPDFHQGYECEKNECYCTVLEKNLPKKIFGTFKETAEIKKEKQCECSISAYHTRKSLNYVLPFYDVFYPAMRCLPNGQFDSLQCVNNMCGCVNRETGAWDFSLKKVPIAALGPNNPKCFDPKRHKVGEYYTDCETERNHLMFDKLHADIEGIDILFSHNVECTPDGEYLTKS